MVERKSPYEVYVAGPLFNDHENDHNISFANLFREAGYSVFNPIENGIEGAKEEEISGHELIVKIHDLDSTLVESTPIFVANLNGPQVDDGTATEIGIALHSQKLHQSGILPYGVEIMIGYFNDTRWLTKTMERNPLPFGRFLKEPNAYFSTREEVVDYAVKRYPPKKS